MKPGNILDGVALVGADHRHGGAQGQGQVWQVAYLHHRCELVECDGGNSFSPSAHPSYRHGPRASHPRPCCPPRVRFSASDTLWNCARYTIYSDTVLLPWQISRHWSFSRFTIIMKDNHHHPHHHYKHLIIITCTPTNRRHLPLMWDPSLPPEKV